VCDPHAAGVDGRRQVGDRPVQHRITVDFGYLPAYMSQLGVIGQAFPGPLVN
jgi:hypothetical protein